MTLIGTTETVNAIVINLSRYMVSREVRNSPVKCTDKKRKDSNLLDSHLH